MYFSLSKTSFILGGLLVLSSCRLTENTQVIPPPVIEQPQAIQQIPPESTANSVLPVKTEDITLSGGMVLQKQITDIDAIDKITSYEELVKLAPIVASLPISHDEKILQIQKNQLMFAAYVRKIENTKFLELQTELDDIMNGKALWNSDLVRADEIYQEALKKALADNTIMSGSFRLFSPEREKLIQELRSTEKFREYIASTAKRQSELFQSMKTYWTPEMIELQKTTEVLRKE